MGGLGWKSDDHGRRGEQVEDRRDRHTQDETARERPLRLAHLARGKHRQLVARIRPEDEEDGRAETAPAQWRERRDALGGLGRVGREERKADGDENAKRNELRHRERIVEPRARLDAPDVHHGDHADEEQLDDHAHGGRIADEVREVIRERQWEYRQRHPLAEIQRPAREESRERAEGLAGIGVRAAHLGQDRRALHEGERGDRSQ